MFLPIGDEPNADEVPWATYSLMACNLAVWCFVCWPRLSQPISLAMPGALDYLDALRAQTGMGRLELLASGTAYDVLMFRWGYRPAAPHIETLFTSMFLHGGWLHLLGNMLFLYIFGDNVEARLGAVRYTLTYLVCGVVATLCYAALKLQSPLPLVGASGAISGVLGCYFVWFPRNRVKVVYTILFFIQRTLVPARVVLLCYLLLENLLPFLFGSAGAGGTAYGAHLGGFVAGAGFAWYDQMASPSGARVRPGRPATGGWSPFAALQGWFVRGSLGKAAPGPNAGQTLGRLLAANQFAQAAAQFLAMGQRDQRRLPAEVQFAVADYLTEQRRYEEALRALRGLITVAGTAPATQARAHLRLGLLYLRGLARPASAYPHLLDALELAGEEAVKATAREALADIERG